MHKRRPSILFPTGIVCCRCGRQKIILIKKSWANLVIGINGRDGPQDGLERTESARSLLWNTDGNGGTPKYCASPGPLRNCNMSKDSQQHDDTDTYPSMPLLAR